MTIEEIDFLNDRQHSPMMHPYTCGRNHPECEVLQNPGDYTKEGILEATLEGIWICPCGKYKQEIKNAI